MNKKYTSKNETAIIFKTHKWNDDIENFVTKIRNETINNAIDLFILVHGDPQYIASQIKNHILRNHVIFFSTQDIKNIYKKGFYGMWLSNHWIMMWFRKQLLQNSLNKFALIRLLDKKNIKYNNYKFIWSIEYDVRIVGDTNIIWGYTGLDDFIYPVNTFQDPKWIWRNHYSGVKFKNEDKWYGYLQLARYSDKFLNYMDSYFNQDENGQDEMITFTLFNLGKSEIGLYGSHVFLNRMINDSWSVFDGDSNKHKSIIAASHQKILQDPNFIIILHPVK